LFLNNIKQSRIILDIRNSFNIRPVLIKLPSDNESYSISDAFCWRNCKNFKTVFRYTDLMQYFSDIKNLIIKLVLCDHNNNILITTDFKIEDLTGKIKINDIIDDKKNKSGHFFLFHELNPNNQEKFLLRNSCYTSYSFKNKVQSVVHGNLPALAKNQNFIFYKKNIIQVSYLKTYNYEVQNNFEEYDKVEAFFFNPVNDVLKVNINELSFKLKPLSSKLIVLPKAKTYKVKSKCLYLRPIFFVYKDKVFDVFHG
tara:strand:- start:84 stop:848 length:765 start_codon:yes stop_codon:yes gene_type:complete